MGYICSAKINLVGLHGFIRLIKTHKYDYIIPKNLNDILSNISMIDLFPSSLYISKSTEIRSNNSNIIKTILTLESINAPYYTNIIQNIKDLKNFINNNCYFKLENRKFKNTSDNTNTYFIAYYDNLHLKRKVKKVNSYEKFIQYLKDNLSNSYIYSENDNNDLFYHKRTIIDLLLEGDEKIIFVTDRSIIFGRYLDLYPDILPTIILLTKNKRMKETIKNIITAP